MPTEVCAAKNSLKIVANLTIPTSEADETNYYVMGTDYFQYAVGWGCENIEDGENLSREFFWVLSRTPELPDSYRERVDAFIDEHFDRAHIRVTEQSDEV